MQMVQIMSVANKIEMSKIAKEQLISQINKQHNIASQSYLKPYIHSVRLLDISDMEYASIIDQLQKNFDIIEYEVYFNTLKNFCWAEADCNNS